jgi:hypothetical protein
MRIWGKNMNKKILLGSILSVVILILVSFTSVVGYNSVDSDVKASPLFNVRSSRAIDEKSEELRCEYVGKGYGSNLLIPNRDNKAAIIQEVIERISKMDDESYNKFVNSLINRFQQNDNFKEWNDNDVIFALYQLRDTSKINDINFGFNNKDKTWRENFIYTICWTPFCIPFLIIYTLFWLYVLIKFAEWYEDLQTSCVMNCWWTL